MSIFHLSATVHSRGKGHSAVAGAAYRARDAMIDVRTGERHDYSRKAADVLFEGIYAPKDSPDWTRDRAQLWNHVEAFEKRRDAQLAKVFDIALPHELTLEQNRRLLQDFVRENFVRKGLVADAVIHGPGRDGDPRNIHAHVAIVLRKLDGTEFSAKKERTASNDERKAELEGQRASWEKLANRHLERAGLDVRIDRRTLQEQGIAAEPAKHLGPEATALERKGVASELGDANREIAQRNAERQALRALETERQAITAEIIDLAAVRAARGHADPLPAIDALRAPQEPRQPPGVGRERETRAGAEERLAGGPAAWERDEAAAGRGAADTVPPVTHGLPTGRARAKEGVRSPGDAAGSIANGIVKGIGAVLGVLEGLFSAPPPPSPEQARQAARAAVEEDRRAAFRQYVAEQAERQSGIVEQSREQRQREQDLADETVRARRRDEERERER